MLELVKSGDAATDEMNITRGGALTRWQKVFITALRKTPSVSHACTVSGVARATAYKYRKENTEFGAQWRDSLEKAVDDLEAVAFKLATEGDSSLISFLLRAHRPEIYKDTQRHEVAIAAGIVYLPEKKVGSP